jgi:hypothetical protein
MIRFLLTTEKDFLKESTLVATVQYAIYGETDFIAVSGYLFLKFNSFKGYGRFLKIYIYVT